MSRGYTPLIYLSISSQVAYFVHCTSRDTERSVCSRHSWRSILSLKHFFSAFGLSGDLRFLLRQLYVEKEEWLPAQLHNNGTVVESEDEMPSLESNTNNDCSKNNTCIKREEGLQCYGDMSLEHLTVMQTPARGEHCHNSRISTSYNNNENENENKSVLFSPVPRKRQHTTKSSSKVHMKSRRSLSSGSGEMFFGLQELYSEEASATPLIPSKTYKARDHIDSNNNDHSVKNDNNVNTTTNTTTNTNAYVRNNIYTSPKQYNSKKPIVQTSPSILYGNTPQILGSKHGSATIPQVPSIKNRRSMSVADSNTINTISNPHSNAIVYSSTNNNTNYHQNQQEQHMLYTPVPRTTWLQSPIQAPQTAMERLHRLHCQYENLKELHPEAIPIKQSSPLIDDSMYIMDISRI